MHKSDSPQTASLYLLAAGVVLFCAASIYIYMGKAWVRFHGWVYRAEEPKSFWWEVAWYYLGGVALVGYALYLLS